MTTDSTPPHQTTSFVIVLIVRHLAAEISPDWVVGRAEIDEEIPRPVSHLEEVAHGAQVHGQ